LIFDWILLVEIQKKKLGLERQNQLSPQFVHIMQIKKFFNSESEKNKECGHTWANGMATLVEGYSIVFGIGIFLIARFG